jgi:N-acetyl-gamma-glutamyl-phosphate reductase
MSSISVFIDGGHGTTGLEIAERLRSRPEIGLIHLDAARRKDLSARREALNDADIAILCLPDAAAVEAVSLVTNDRTCIIDASTAHRTAPGWTYGFHEIFAGGKEALRTAKRISNPGCYPTGFLALVKPLLDAGLIQRDWPLTVNAVSGYSGGGKAMIAEFEEGATDTSWRTYGLDLAHKHVAEMQRHAGLVHSPLFAPSVARTYRGMIVDVPLMVSAMQDAPSPSAIRACLEQAFASSPIVRLIAGFDQANLTLEHAAGTDRLDLFVFQSAAGRQIRLVAALDNLGKGAGGACVQALNIAAGFDETAGLLL